MHVEIDVFSGRANPGWSLSPAEAHALRGRLQRLPPGRPPPERLGFRGFVVHRPDRSGRARPWLRVGGGSVRVLAGPGRGLYRDAAGLEAWLVDEATRRGFGALVGRASGES